MTATDMQGILQTYALIVAIVCGVLVLFRQMSFREAAAACIILLMIGLVVALILTAVL